MTSMEEQPVGRERAYSLWFCRRQRDLEEDCDRLPLLPLHSALATHTNRITVQIAVLSFFVDIPFAEEGGPHFHLLF